MGQSAGLHGRLISIFILLFLVPCLIAQQDRQSVIRGTVKDTKGSPLEFATVYVEEIRQGTQSNQNGGFLLRVAPGNMKRINRWSACGRANK